MKTKIQSVPIFSNQRFFFHFVPVKKSTKMDSTPKKFWYLRAFIFTTNVAIEFYYTIAKPVAVALTDISRAQSLH